MKKPLPTANPRASRAAVPLALAAVTALALGLVGALPASAAPPPTHLSAETLTAPRPAMTRMSPLVGHAPSTVEKAAQNAVKQAASSDQTSSSAVSRARVAAPSATTPKAPSGTPSTDLVITSPADEDMVQFVSGPRTITVVGTAPARSVITVHNDQEELLTTVTADKSGAFTFTVSFSDAVSWDQLLVIDGKSGARGLTEHLIEVQFDAPDTEVPVVDSSIVGQTLIGTPLPFGGGLFSIPVSGTAKPGDQVFVLADPTDTTDPSFGDGAFATADANGQWTARLALGPGSYFFTPVAQTIDEVLGPLSGYTEGARIGTAEVAIPADYLVPPVVNETVQTNFDGSEPTSSGTAASDPLDPDDGVADAAEDATDEPTTEPTTDPGVEPTDGATDGGAQYLAVVSGTGTPGTGVQLWVSDLDSADAYLSALYPGWFDDSTAPPSATVPTYDGTITVGADGRWSKDLGLPSGTFVAGAFTVDTSDPTSLRYSVIGNTVIFDVAATDDGVIAASASGAISPGADTPATELAFTGSEGRSMFLVAVGLLGLGVALMLTMRTRNRRAPRPE